MILLVPLGLMLRRTPETIVRVFEPDSTRIRCPLCAWQPVESDTWLCSPGCGHVWNTFETRGVCPGCDKQWAQTACLRCSQWSPHEAWYERSQG